MKMYLKILLIILVCLFSRSPAATADQLHLENGDVITGKMVRMENQKLVFKTDYAGEISVDWKKIKKLIAEESIRVLLTDGAVLEGYTGAAGQTNMTLEADKIETPARFNLADVKAINPADTPVVKITVGANLGFDQERGNSDTDNTHLDGKLKARTEKNRFLFGGELNKEKESGDTSSDNWKAFGKYDYFLTEKWFLYSLALFENDEFTDLDLRSTLGIGTGYQFFESDRLNLYVSAGPGYVNENYNVADDKDFAVGQWVISYDQYFFGETFQLFHNQYGYFQVDDSGNWLVNTRQGIRVPIYKGFNATFQYDYEYDNQPSKDTDEKWDSKLMFLLGWEFSN